MQVPFTQEQFLDLLRQYNEAVFPLQFGLYILVAVILYHVARPGQGSAKIISGILGFLWVWMGIAYHLLFFTTINKAAYLFALAFVAEGIILLFLGMRSHNLSLKHFALDKFGILGMTLVIFALVVYPLLGFLNGHIYPISPTFGLPCPTTIFTFGIMMISFKKIPWAAVVIPLIWSVIGFTAAFKFGITEDYGLLTAGLIIFTLLVIGHQPSLAKTPSKN